MPSASETALSRGFDALLSVSGETVTFRGDEVTALIDRAASSRANDTRFVDFTAREGSSVEFRKTDLASIPLAGEIITDSLSKTHRIQTVEHLGHAYRCACHVAD